MNLHSYECMKHIITHFFIAQNNYKTNNTITRIVLQIPKKQNYIFNIIKVQFQLQFLA